MKKGQKLSRATNYARELQKRKNDKQYYKKQRSASPRQPTRTYRTRPSGSANKYLYESDSIKKYLNQILVYAYRIIKNFFQKIFS